MEGYRVPIQNGHLDDFLKTAHILGIEYDLHFLLGFGLEYQDLRAKLEKSISPKI